MSQNGEADSLGQLIHAARKRRGLTLDEVVGLLPKPHQGHERQWLHGIEQKGNAKLGALVQLHQALVGQKYHSPTDTLGHWLQKWAEREAGGEPESQKLLCAEMERLLALDHKHHRVAPAGSLTLEHFPEAFFPLTVICGDRRELTPKTLGDLFAYSVSIIDMTFIFKLGLPPETKIRSDKLCLLLSQESLKRLFGHTNLLVIGSPAVNFASRIVNSHSLFRFDLEPEIKLWQKRVSGLTHLRQREHLRVFAQMLRNPKPLSVDPKDYGDTNLSAEEIAKLVKDFDHVIGVKSERAILNDFRKGGFIDPVDQRVHGKASQEDNDSAVISLARNPFADPESQYVAIFVAGIHGPGSVQAVNALARGGNRNPFGDHPFGGILDVQLGWAEQWSERLENASWRWQTAPYSVRTLRKNLEDKLPQFSKHEPTRTSPPLSSEEFASCIKLIDAMNQGKAHEA